MNTINTYLDRLLSIISAIILAAMMLLVGIDVISREFFDPVFSASFELTGYMLAILIFTSLPLVTKADEHISVGLLDNIFKGRVGQVRDSVVYSIMTFLFSLLGWRLIVFAGFTSKNPSETYGLPYPPVFMFMGIMLLVNAIICFVKLFEVWSKESISAIGEHNGS